MDKTDQTAEQQKVTSFLSHYYKDRVPMARGLTKEDEVRLFKCHREGDDNARKEIIEAHLFIVGGYMMSLGKAYNLTPEILISEANDELCRIVDAQRNPNKAHFNPELSSFSTYLFIRIRSRSMMFRLMKHSAVLRKACKKIFVDSFEGRPELLGDQGLLENLQNEFEDALDQSSRKQAVLTLLDTASERDRELATYLYFDEMSVDEISRILGITCMAVRNRHKKMLATFRKLLKEDPRFENLAEGLA